MPSWLRLGRSMYDPAAEFSRRADTREPRLIRLALSVAMSSVPPGQPMTVA
ncbi:hypothetical protein [Saccharothrix sp. ALI-22-I]|uniref:hypothetical protein n=1 Tax=Saccharothrix sp. ALI-22-I TaxID=1933778 RepID=UPI001EE72A75|nr:hypothetical protein [Saccharothrix sp. ALI-22-I]